MKQSIGLHFLCFLMIALVLMLSLPSQAQTSATPSASGDGSIIRLLYDQLYSRFVPSARSLSPTQISKVLLLGLPGTVIRAEDFSKPLWKSSGFVGSDPDRLLFD